MKTENITCQCGNIFDWTHDNTEKFWTDALRPKHCPSCESIIIEQSEREAKRIRLEETTAAIQSGIDEVTPPRYRQTDIRHPDFNRPLWRQVSAWEPTDTTPFLGLVGASGACKTRVAYLRFRELVLELAKPYIEKNSWIRPSVALTSGEFARLVAQQFSNTGLRDLWDNPTPPARRQLDAIRDCPILFLDDLGKAKNTPSVSAELFAVIDHRHAQNLPTIWTANSQPNGIVSGMTEDMAGPLAGRLIECSNIITIQ